MPSSSRSRSQSSKSKTAASKTKTSRRANSSSPVKGSSKSSTPSKKKKDVVKTSNSKNKGKESKAVSKKKESSNKRSSRKSSSSPSPAKGHKSKTNQKKSYASKSKARKQRHRSPSKSSGEEDQEEEEEDTENTEDSIEQETETSPPEDKKRHKHSKSHPPPDLQSWCEVPSIAHFCSLFRQAFDLLEFDIQELEESFLLMGSEDDTSQLVLRLVIKLLKGCSRTFTNNINEDNYNTYLRRLFLSKREEAEEDQLEYNFECRGLLDDGIDFGDLSLWHRVRIVNQLCEFRLEAEDVMEKVKNLDATSLRVEPLGIDSDGVTYWYFYGTRLYKETPPPNDDKLKRKKEKDKKKKKKDKKEKKKKKKRSYRDSVSSAEEDEIKAIWSVACLTLQDWENLTEKYKKSKKKCDRELYETLSESFLPEIVKMFAEKEKEEKRRLMMLAPKRASSRIERKRQEQEERDRLLAEKLEEERRLEELYDEKVRMERQKQEEEDREKAREERRLQREKIKELRAKRAAEREVEKEYAFEVSRQKKLVEEMTEKERTALSLRRARFGSSDEEDEDDAYIPPSSLAKKSKDQDDDNSSVDSLEFAYSPKERTSKQRMSSKQDTKNTFTNALLKAGTKSLKDSTLEKPYRKTPGLLLETAGRSLMQKSAATAAKSNPHGIGSPGHSSVLGGSGGGLFDAVRTGNTANATAKLSFGLYGGHLPIDHGSYTKSEGSDNDSDSHGSASFSAIKPVRKVFTNWGGEFFKKNLDYRANTNKILEKMNLGNHPSGVKPSSSSSTETFRDAIGDNSSNALSNASSPLTSFVPGERFKALLQSTTTNSPKRPLETSSSSSSNSSDTKKLKFSNFI